MGNLAAIEKRQSGRGTWRHVLHCLVALHLAVVALVPHGYMPDLSGGGNTIVICTADGLVTIPDPALPTDDKPHHTLCSFSLHAQPLLTTGVTVAVQIDAPSEAVFRPFRDDATNASRRYTPVLPRAPPIA